MERSETTHWLQPPAQSAWMGRLIPLLIIAAAGWHYYRAPAVAAELEVIPDSVEYAVAANRFVNTGVYDIQANGQSLPPRYPPGFSVLFLAPIYFFAPANLGNGILAVWFMAIAAIVLAYCIGREIAGVWGGTLAALLLGLHSEFGVYTQLVMTDVPSVTLGLFACWVFLRMRDEEASVWLYLLAGITVAISMSMRPLTGVLALPFVVEILYRSIRSLLPEHRKREKVFFRFVLLALPCAFAVAATALWQAHAIGDWRRTGYQFWLPVPYDYFELTFSKRYFRDNIALLEWHLLYLPVLGGMVGFYLLQKRRAPKLRAVAAFLLLGAAPLSVMHLFYFFRGLRFHFLSIAILSIIAACGIALTIPQRLRDKFAFLLPIAILCVFLPRMSDDPLDIGTRVRDQVATAAAEALPDDAVLISNIDPVYLEHRVARGTHRRVLPISRHTPYARALLARRRIAKLTPPPRNAADHACAGLRAGGDPPLYAFTANEEIGTLKKMVAAGVPVYLDELSTEADDPARIALAAAFELTPRSSRLPWLVQLQLR